MRCKAVPISNDLCIILATWTIPILSKNTAECNTKRGCWIGCRCANDVVSFQARVYLKWSGAFSTRREILVRASRRTWLLGDMNRCPRVWMDAALIRVMLLIVSFCYKQLFLFASGQDNTCILFKVPFSVNNAS
jgi:hypothetical protein